MKRNDHPSTSTFETSCSENDLEIDDFENDPELQELAAQLEATDPEGIMSLEFRESLRSTLLHHYEEYQ